MLWPFVNGEVHLYCLLLSQESEAPTAINCSMSAKFLFLELVFNGFVGGVNSPVIQPFLTHYFSEVNVMTNIIGSAEKVGAKHSGNNLSVKP